MDTNSTLASFDTYFSSIKDPRKPQGVLHKMRAILLIGVLSVISGADDFVEMEGFGKSNADFLKDFLSLKNGIPSHDTFGRAFSMLSPQEFQTCLTNWAKDLCGDMTGDVVNIDGKALRHSYDTHTGRSMIYMVSAWANSNDLLLAQQKVEERSNEITAIPKLLDLIDIVGSLVTIPWWPLMPWVSKKRLQQR